MLNKQQKTVIAIGALLEILAFIFPRWTGVNDKNCWAWGYSVFTGPPAWLGPCKVDFLYTLLMAIIILIMTAIGVHSINGLSSSLYENWKLVKHHLNKAICDKLIVIIGIILLLLTFLFPCWSKSDYGDTSYKKYYHFLFDHINGYYIDFTLMGAQAFLIITLVIGILYLNRNRE